VAQQIDCGQTVDWAITPESCTFRDAPTTALASFRIFASHQLPVTMEATSSSFQPLLSLWDSRRSIARGTEEDHRSVLSHTFTGTNINFPELASRFPLQGGDFRLVVECARPSCHYPILLSQPRVLRVRRGERVTLTVDVDATEPLSFAWTEAARDIQTVSFEREYTTPPIESEAVYFVRVQNGCGVVQGGPIHVEVEDQVRRRPSSPR
jgi:hypothetical protein